MNTYWAPWWQFLSPDAPHIGGSGVRGYVGWGANPRYTTEPVLRMPNEGYGSSSEDAWHCPSMENYKGNYGLSQPLFEGGSTANLTTWASEQWPADGSAPEGNDEKILYYNLHKTVTPSQVYLMGESPRDNFIKLSFDDTDPVDDSPWTTQNPSHRHRYKQDGTNGDCYILYMDGALKPHKYADIPARNSALPWRNKSHF
jgi:hypothetical protein